MCYIAHMDIEDIRKTVIDHRKAIGLTQSEVGARAKLRRELISNFENDHQDIGLRRLVRLCDALGLELIVRPGRGRPVFEDLDGLFGDEG